MTKQMIIRLIFLIIGLIWIFYSAVPPGSTTDGHIPAPHPGFLAPEFSLIDSKGNNLALSDFRGKIVILNFWASWCAPCKAEMPAFQRVFIAQQSQKVIILAVNASSQDRRDNALAFVSKNNLTFPILFDEGGSVNRLYAIRALPTTFFIDENGMIADIVIGGPIQEAVLMARIQALTSEK
jgi:peroxiredoxin